MDPVAPNSLMVTVSSFLPFILVLLVMYFLVLRPQKIKQKELEDMLANMKKGDKVVTKGGIVGTISEIKDDMVVLKTDSGSNIDILRTSICDMK
ncbi:preprotein translocase subunit YajC [PVC group bacterium (ex Bugula neritina AB1)]|nr:preprotein translocase subunit YajC [PVC group bacterium (ex Bugula neritina AB1)]